MKFNSTLKTLESIKADCICLPVSGKQKLGAAGKAFDASCEGRLSEQIKLVQPKTEIGETTIVTVTGAEGKPALRVLLFGTGSKENDKLANNDALQKTSKSIAATLSQTNVKHVALSPSDEVFEGLDLDQTVKSFISAFENQAYSFNVYKSDKKTTPQNPAQLSFTCTKETQSACKNAIKYGVALALGQNQAKDLGNQPGNVCTPSFLAEEAKKLGKASPELSVKVLSEKDMEKLNMGAFLSVSKGSSEPGKLIIMEYSGGKKSDAPHVFVGKGITFDTGGISLKPGPQMDEMKYDMCGAASVIGLMSAVSELNLKANVIGVIAAAENMPAGNASKPGDIVTTSSGQTVEILNTDAEGRLVLCDALTYVERFKPASVVDIATLTGACIIALGNSTSAVMSNDDELAEKLLQAGQAANDKAWQLPLWDEYQSQLDSPFADMQNIGGKGAGSITAGCFLSRFAKKYKWAHLDVAGTAWVSGGKEKGATGRPVPLLLQYLTNQIS